MIQLVIENLRPSRQEHRFIFIAQRAHVVTYGLESRLEEWAPGCVVVQIDGLTDGAARTVLAAREYIDNDDALMIANSDQYVDMKVDDYLEQAPIEASGMIMTMTDKDPKWSFVQLDLDGRVTKVVEKVVVSDQATVGIYNFTHGSSFVWAADAMISNGKMTNGEYYVAPTYNELIDRGDVISASNIGTAADGMFGLGIPSDLDFFISSPVSKRALAVFE